MTRERNSGFDSAMALWAISDLEGAAIDILSSANRLSAVAFIQDDRPRVKRAMARIDFAMAELRKLVAAETVAA